MSLAKPVQPTRLDRSVKDALTLRARVKRITPGTLTRQLIEHGLGVDLFLEKLDALGWEEMMRRLNRPSPLWDGSAHEDECTAHAAGRLALRK